MLNSSYRLLTSQIKLVSFVVLFFVAFYVLIGRTALSILPEYQEDFEQILSEQIQLPVKVSSITGRWIGFDPVLEINGLSVNGAENIYIGRARIRVSFLASIIALSPRFKSIIVEQSELSIIQVDDGGSWQLASIAIPESDGEPASDFSILNEILDGVAIRLIDSTFQLRHQQGKVQMLRMPDVNLSYEDDKFYASGKVLQEEGNKTLLNFSIEGRGVLTDESIAGTLYLEARSAEFFDRVLKTYHWETVSIQNVDASARLWLSFDGFNVTSMQGNAQISRLNWLVAEKSVPPILNATVDVQLTMAEDKQFWFLNGLNLNWAGNKCETSHIQIIKEPVQVEVKASELNVKCVSRLTAALGILPKELQDRLDTSLPDGALNNINLTVRELNDANILTETLVSNLSVPTQKKHSISSFPIERFDFEAELDNVSLKAYSGTPSVKGVDGYIKANTKGGGVYFESSRFELGFPDLFTNTWQMKRTEGAVSWVLKEDEIFVHSEGLRLYHQDDSIVYGDFFLRLNSDEKEDYLSLALGMQDIAFTNASKFVPSLIVGEDLNAWLDESLASGVVTEGIYIGYGSIESDAPENSFTSSILLKTAKGELSFAPEWPHLEELDAEVSLQNNELNVFVARAKIKETELYDVNAKMLEDANGETNNLQIKAKLHAGKSELDYWLKESPISSNTEHVIKQLEIEGVVGVDLNLNVPLSSEEDVAYLIKSTFKNAHVKHLETDLSFLNVEGVLKVSSVDGVTANDINADFLGQKSQVNIATLSEFGQKYANSSIDSQTQISIDSGIPVNNLLDYFEQDQIYGLGGHLNYHAELNIPSKIDEHPRLKISSNLKGVYYDCPAPLKKTVDEMRNLELSVLIEPEQLDLQVNLTSNISSELTSKIKFMDNKFSFGEILIGGALSKKANDQGIQVAAVLDAVELEPWVEFVQKNLEGQETSDTALLRSIDLDINDMRAYGQNFKQAHAFISKPKDHWQLELNGERVQGVVHFPSENSVLDIQLEHIYLDDNESEQQVIVSLEAGKHAGALDPRKLPEIKFSTQKLMSNNVSYGSWKTHVFPNDKGAIFKGVKGDIAGASFEGQLNWKIEDISEEEKVHTSILTMDVKGKKFEKLTKAIGIEPLISSDSFDSSISLVWPGSPDEFELSDVSGSIKLKMEDGFLNTEDAKTGALRVFGILNAESIMRRLKLDFSDLYKSGVGYDIFSVETTINRGLLTFVEPLVIDGPSSNYQINGSVDLKKETLDMDMLVNLPVVQNIPLAALILGAPQIGGVVWVVDKLLGEPLSAITTARYDITGSWNKPKMKLNQAMNASKKDRSIEKSRR